MVSLACMYAVAMYVVTSLSSCTVIGCHVILLFKCMCIPHLELSESTVIVSASRASAHLSLSLAGT